MLIADAGGDSAGDPGDPRGVRSPRPTLDDLFGGAEPHPGDSATDDNDRAETLSDGGDGDDRGGEPDDDADASASLDSDDLDLTASVKSDEIRDLILAAEESGTDDDGREVTAAPSDADQDETARIVTEAVEAGASPQEIEANEAGGGRNVPPLPPTEPFSTDPVEGRDAEMNQP